jgi:hypothetical protein
MLVQFNSLAPSMAPKSQPGPAPDPKSAATKAQPDRVARPQAHLSTPISPPPHHLVDGTPEVLTAALGLAGVAFGADVTVLGAAMALRSAGTYVSKLAGGIVRCVSDPVSTGEHIAEGVVGGAAWAGAAAGVSALADAARSHVATAHPATH